MEITDKIIELLNITNGNTKLGLFSCKNTHLSCYLLFNETVLLYTVFLETKNDTTYIKLVDSTGYYKGIIKDFISAILKVVNTSKVCCFSQPKPEYILVNSNKNGEKKLLDATTLMNFWIEIFKNTYKTIHVWSNHYTNASYPFKSMDEITYFEDDPKQKLSKHFKGSIKDFFTSLLCRTDFTQGALVYGLDQKNKSSVNFKAFPKGNTKIKKIEKFFKKLDFETKEKSIKSTKQLIDKFKMNIKWFEYSAKIKKEECSDNTDKIILQPKRKKLNPS